MSTDGPDQGVGARVAPPVLVLGSHRSGTSAVTGLLAEAAGLELGEVMPPTSANAKGYFESVAIVRGHNRVLASMDRDWTCPPPSFDPTDVPRAGIEEEVALLDGSGRPWGLKDPRLLYMLPLWAALLDEVRFVGVVRDHEEVVRSLVARDGLDPAVADAVTRAHVHRLRVLADRFDIPVIDFSAGAAAVIDRCRAIAEDLGLAWDEQQARTFFDASLAATRARGMADHVDVDHLREDATSRTSVPVVTRPALQELLTALAEEPDELDRHSGPRSAARRRRVWGSIPRGLAPAIELVATLDVAASVDPVPEGGRTVVAEDLLTLHRELREADPLARAVVLPDVTSWIRADELAPMLRLVHAHVPHDGVVAIGLSTADRDTRRWRGQPPIEVDDIRTAALGAGYVTLADEQADEHLHVLTLSVLPTATSVLQTLVGRGSGGRVRGAVSSPAPSQSAGDGSTAVEVRDAAVWRRRYERLAGRRSVRLALSIADLTRPLFQLVRRVRKRLGV